MVSAATELGSESGALNGALPLVASPKPAAPKRFVRQQVPDELLHNEALNSAIGVLPANYSFEIHKTIWRIQQLKARIIALQFPEGLLMYSCIISDILESFAGVDHCLILGDVTFGACCVDDLSAQQLGADLLVHYGHSCLVPVDQTSIPCLYVFVDITVDTRHLIDTIRLNFEPGTCLALAGTIQFGSSIQAAKSQLAGTYPSLAVPQSKPLSPGEVLGCTAPIVPSSTQAIVFVADGRFHLEAIMIANPSIPAFRYDPYARVMLKESYDHQGMRAVRKAAIHKAREASLWGVVLGTLGRQGNPRVFDHLCQALAAKQLQYVQVLLSEVTPAKLAAMEQVDAWVQVACPRLSIDWGEGFLKPTLTPYEALVSLGAAPGWWEQAGPPSHPPTDSSPAAAVPQQTLQPADQGKPGPTSPAAAAAQAQQAPQPAAEGAGRHPTLLPGVRPAAAATEDATQPAQLAAAPCERCGGTAAGEQPCGASCVSEGVSGDYPMDYYSQEGGVWSSTYHRKGPRRRSGLGHARTS